ncbi:MAG: ribosome maturation factor RimM [Bauldia sp.]|nr:ribosome maturation factor RimM [Bauldia sp.]
MAAPHDRVVLARLGAAHGIRGEIRLKSYTGVPADVADYGPLEAPDGRKFVIAAIRPVGDDMFVVRLDGVSDRTAAEALNGIELSIPRALLPEPDEDDFYHADLIGLAACSPAGEVIGTVTGVFNHGAGDLIEIAPAAGEPMLVPFTRETVPIVDIARGRLIVSPLPESEGDDEDEPP